MARHERIDKVVLNLFRHAAGRHCRQFDGHGDALFHASELFVEYILAVLSQLLQVVEVLHRDGQHNGCRAGNGVAHVATLPGAETCGVIDDSLTHEAGHQLVGIGTSRVDFQAAVTATQALEQHLHGDVTLLQGNGLVLNRSCDVHAASRTDDELAHRLVVDVQEDVAFQRIGRKVVHAVHARLFVGRDEGFQRAVLDVLTFHDGHDGSHAHAVVAAQRRALRLHPVAVDEGLDGVRLEVVRALVRLLRHHVHVCLQHSALGTFAARSGRLAHHDVLSAILEGFYAMLLSPVEQELLHLLKVSAWARYLCQ